MKSDTADVIVSRRLERDEGGGLINNRFINGEELSFSDFSKRTDSMGLKIKVLANINEILPAFSSFVPAVDKTTIFVFDNVDSDITPDLYPVFVSALKELAGKTQCIFVSGKKEIIVAATGLIGITMCEEGDTKACCVKYA